MTYALFFAPAALVVAVLTLMVVPFLSLVVFMIGLLVAATAGVAVAVKGLAAAFQAGSNHRLHGHEPPPIGAPPSNPQSAL